MNSGNDQKVVTSEDVEAAHLEAVQAKSKDLEDRFDSSKQIRERALVEFALNTEFMQTCGTLDRSYDNCVVELSDDLKPYYSMALDSGDDGYSMVLNATSKNHDNCRSFESNSNGELIGINDRGEPDKNCLLDLANSDNTFKVFRDTDNTSGQSAPSGLTPLVKHLTNR